MGEDKDREKYKKKSQGRCIIHKEILHLMLKYPEVMTNLDFIIVSAFLLEIRAGIIVDSGMETEDGEYFIAEVLYPLSN